MDDVWAHRLLNHLAQEVAFGRARLKVIAMRGGYRLANQVQQEERVLALRMRLVDHRCRHTTSTITRTHIQD